MNAASLRALRDFTEGEVAFERRVRESHINRALALISVGVAIWTLGSRLWSQVDALQGLPASYQWAASVLLLVQGGLSITVAVPWFEDSADPSDVVDLVELWAQESDTQDHEGDVAAIFSLTDEWRALLRLNQIRAVLLVLSTTALLCAGGVVAVGYLVAV